MTLRELVDGIPDFASWPYAAKLKLFAWYLHGSSGLARFQPADIRACFDELSLQAPANISTYLGRLTKTKPRQILRDRHGYSLEKRLRDDFEARYGQRSATVQVHKLLSDLPRRIPNLAQRAFLEEALVCLRHGAPRAAIVMTWNLAFDHLCDYILANHLAAFNAQWPVRFARKHGKSSIKAVTCKEDFAQLKESEVIDICRSANIITANISKILKEKLDRRNIAAHPNAVVMTTLQAEDFISDLVSNVVLQLV